MECKWCYQIPEVECSGLCTTADKANQILNDIARLERSIRLAEPEEAQELIRAIDELKLLYTELVKS